MRINKIIAKARVDSTSEALKREAAEIDSGTLLWAEAQTKGRGTHGKKWVASPGENLTFSFLIRHKVSYQAALQAATALALRDLLLAYRIESLFKLPNDVYASNKKIAGILVETKTTHNSQQTVIGVGLNVHEKFDASLPSAISMHMLNGVRCDLPTLLNAFIARYNDYIHDEAFPRFKRWVLSTPVYANYLGKTVKIVDFDTQFTYDIIVSSKSMRVDGAHLTFEIPQ